MKKQIKQLIQKQSSSYLPNTKMQPNFLNQVFLWSWHLVTIVGNTSFHLFCQIIKLKFYYNTICVMGKRTNIKFYWIKKHFNQVWGSHYHDRWIFGWFIPDTRVFKWFPLGKILSQASRWSKYVPSVGDLIHKGSFVEVLLRIILNK